MQNLANEPLWSCRLRHRRDHPGLAAGDPDYNEDFTALTFPLREGVTWSDGEPFTAADVVFTVETLMAHDGFNDNSFFVEM
jgi:peptide/nickel transport system substrate-binding protein